MICSLTACSGNESSATEEPSSTSQQAEISSVIDESDSDLQEASKDIEAEDDSKDEEINDESLPDKKETEAAGETPEGFSVIGGTWEVGGIYYKGHLIDINDNDAIESMYDTTMVIFNEDGTFVYLKMYNDRGVWSEKEGSGGVFILKTESTFMYDLQNGSLVEKETESSNKKQYIATLLDENTFILNEYDSITGKAKVNDDPYIFVKQGESSKYIAENKTPINNTGSTQSGTENKPSQLNNTDIKNATFGEKNALEKALQYLDYSAFSYSGLVDQLEYEGFTSSEAQYGADNCGADWNEQAAKKAKQYLEYSSFSKSELIDQLVFEGFTQSQAEYGASKVY